MEINIIIGRGYSGIIKAAWLRSIAREALDAENIIDGAEMSLLVTGQRKIRALNKKWMDEDAPTDVLSFPMQEKADRRNAFPAPDDVIHLGEVIISYPQAFKQAEERGHGVRDEFIILLIHGILHLLGYDHDVPSRTRKMRAREAAILNIIKEKRP